MDLTHPLTVVTPTLDGPVLTALAATTGSSTGAHVHRIAGTGSPDGVRRVLARLVAQGIVLAEEHAHATLYRLNRDHVAVPAIIELTRLRAKIVELVTAAIAAWPAEPIHASLFGSFARGEADALSDIDVLVVADPEAAQGPVWANQIDELGALVLGWTGNHAHIISATPATLSDMLSDMLSTGDPLITSWRADGIHLRGQRLTDLLRNPTLGAGTRARQPR